MLLSNKSSKIKVLIYRTTPHVSGPPTKEPDALQKPETTASNRKTLVYECDMVVDAKQNVLNKAKRLVDFYQNEKEADTKIAQSLKQSLTLAYGQTWHVIVTTSPREFACVPIHDEGTLMDVLVDNKYRIVAYEHEGTSMDNHLDLIQLLGRFLFILAAMCMALFVYLNNSPVLAKCLVEKEDELSAENAPIGCSAEDLVRAQSTARWKTFAYYGIMIFTVAGSFLRMYKRTLKQKYKYE